MLRCSLSNLSIYLDLCTLFEILCYHATHFDLNITAMEPPSLPIRPPLSKATKKNTPQPHPILKEPKKYKTKIDRGPIAASTQQKLYERKDEREQRPQTDASPAQSTNRSPSLTNSQSSNIKTPRFTSRLRASSSSIQLPGHQKDKLMHFVAVPLAKLSQKNDDASQEETTHRQSIGHKSHRPRESKNDKHHGPSHHGKVSKLSSNQQPKHNFMKNSQPMFSPSLSPSVSPQTTMRHSPGLLSHRGGHANNAKVKLNLPMNGRSGKGNNLVAQKAYPKSPALQKHTVTQPPSRSQSKERIISKKRRKKVDCIAKAVRDTYYRQQNQQILSKNALKKGFHQLFSDRNDQVKIIPSKKETIDYQINGDKSKTKSKKKSKGNQININVNVSINGQQEVTHQFNGNKNSINTQMGFRNHLLNPSHLLSQNHTISTQSNVNHTLSTNSNAQTLERYSLKTEPSTKVISINKDFDEEPRPDGRFTTYQIGAKASKLNTGNHHQSYLQSQVEERAKRTKKGTPTKLSQSKKTKPRTKFSNKVQNALFAIKKPSKKKTHSLKGYLEGTFGSNATTQRSGPQQNFKKQKGNARVESYREHLLEKDNFLIYPALPNPSPLLSLADASITEAVNFNLKRHSPNNEKLGNTDLRSRTSVIYHDAAITIQRHLRGHLTRRRLEEMKMFIWTIVRIQSWWRGVAQRKRIKATSMVKQPTFKVFSQSNLTATPKVASGIADPIKETYQTQFEAQLVEIDTQFARNPNPNVIVTNLKQNCKKSDQFIFSNKLNAWKAQLLLMSSPISSPRASQCVISQLKSEQWFNSPKNANNLIKENVSQNNRTLKGGLSVESQFKQQSLKELSPHLVPDKKSTQATYYGSQQLIDIKLASKSLNHPNLIQEQPCDERAHSLNNHQTQQITQLPLFSDTPLPKITEQSYFPINTSFSFIQEFCLLLSECLQSEDELREGFMKKLYAASRWAWQWSAEWWGKGLQIRSLCREEQKQATSQKNPKNSIDQQIEELENLQQEHNSSRYSQSQYSSYPPLHHMALTDLISSSELKLLIEAYDPIKQHLRTYGYNSLLEMQFDMPTTAEGLNHCHGSSPGVAFLQLILSSLNQSLWHQFRCCWPIYRPKMTVEYVRLTSNNRLPVMDSLAIEPQLQDGSVGKEAQIKDFSSHFVPHTLAQSLTTLHRWCQCNGAYLDSNTGLSRHYSLLARQQMNHPSLSRNIFANNPLQSYFVHELYSQPYFIHYSEELLVQDRDEHGWLEGLIAREVAQWVQLTIIEEQSMLLYLNNSKVLQSR